MSYANATVSPAARVKAASGVIAIHALLGAGVYLGLTISGVIDPPTFNPEVINVPIETPPPDEVEVPDDVVTPYSPPAAPDPLIDIPRADPIDPVPLNPIFDDRVLLDPNPPVIEVPGPVAPPANPLFDPVGPLPTNGPTGWITNNDYPRQALVRGWEGTSGYRLVVGSNGRVDACEITRSSGHAVLDREACRQLERRARFDPAKNNRGNEVVGTYTGQVTWQIPD